MILPFAKKNQNLFATAQASADLDQVLASLAAVRAPSGLEERVMRQLRSSSMPAANKPGRLVGGWVPLAAAASLACVLGGGFLVARETARTFPLQIGSQTAATGVQAAVHASEVRQPGSVLAGGAGESQAARGLSTAAARRQTVGPVVAGSYRGRATVHQQAGHSQARLPMLAGPQK